MNPREDFDLDRSRSISDQIYLWLRSEIVSLALKPGHVLSESELANRLGVSRTPTRQAIKKLEEEGFVESVPNLGTFVSLFGVGVLIEAQFIRESLECSLIRRAAERIDPETTETLQYLLAEQAASVEAGEDRKFYLLDQDFHRTICSMSGMPGIWKRVELVVSHLNRVRRLSMSLPFVPTEAVEQHQDILDCLVARNPDGAEKAMRKHLNNILKVLPEIRAEHTHYFSPAD